MKAYRAKQWLLLQWQGSLNMSKLLIRKHRKKLKDYSNESRSFISMLVLEKYLPSNKCFSHNVSVNVIKGSGTI